MNGPELSDEHEHKLDLQLARQEAYRDGEYELDEDEGFNCDQCGWRALSAPANDGWADADVPLTKCGRCGEPDPSTCTPINWDRVEEKLPDEYIDW
jgi:hypothetical protein